MELEERERGELHKIVVGGVAAVPGYSALALSLGGSESHQPHQSRVTGEGCAARLASNSGVTLSTFTPSSLAGEETDGAKKNTADYSVLSPKNRHLIGHSYTVSSRSTASQANPRPSTDQLRRDSGKAPSDKRVCEKNPQASQGGQLENFYAAAHRPRSFSAKAVCYSADIYNTEYRAIHVNFKSRTNRQPLLALT